MITPTTALAITQLTLYILLLPALIYLLITHSKHTLPGYLYLLLFAILQLISASLQISNPQSPTSSILSSVGLSPLLLGLAGILHSAHTFFFPKPPTAERAKLAWAFQLALHLLTVAGVLIIALSSSNLSKDTGTGKYTTDLTLRKAGALLLLLAFLAIVAYAVWILVRHRRGGANDSRKAMNLLYGALVALPFVFVRLVSTVVYEFARPGTETFRALSPITASIAIRVVFLLLVPLLAVVGLILGGFLSRGLARRRAQGGAERFEEVGSGELQGVLRE